MGIDQNLFQENDRPALKILQARHRKYIGWSRMQENDHTPHQRMHRSISDTEREKFFLLLQLQDESQ